VGVSCRYLRVVWWENPLCSVSCSVVYCSKWCSFAHFRNLLNFSARVGSRSSSGFAQVCFPRYWVTSTGMTCSWML